VSHLAALCPLTGLVVLSPPSLLRRANTGVSAPTA